MNFWTGLLPRGKFIFLGYKEADRRHVIGVSRLLRQHGAAAWPSPSHNADPTMAPHVDSAVVTPDDSVAATEI